MKFNQIDKTIFKEPTSKKPSFSSEGHRKIILIDDDLGFVTFMRKLSKYYEDIYFFGCENADHLDPSDFLNFDLAIIDYHLGNLNALQLVNYLHHFKGAIPTILISQSKVCKEEKLNWPSNVIDFIPKGNGGREIIEKSISSFEKYIG